MPKAPNNWPPAAIPRGLDVEMAAYYVGLSPTAFRSRVKAGIYPQPRQDGGRMIWDRDKLDASFGGKKATNRNVPDFIDLDEEAKMLKAI